MKQAIHEGPRQDGVTIDPVNKGNIDAKKKEGAGQSTTSETMAPKPALYESGKRMDNERNLIAASDEAHYARKDVHGESYDDASEATDHSVISHSDYSTTDGEESIASNSRKEKRSRRRRSRRRRSRSRSKDGRSKRSERGSRERDVEYEEEAFEPETPQENRYEESSEPRRSSVTSHNFQGTGEHEISGVTMKTGKADHQIKLLNFNALYRAEQDRSPRRADELEKVVTNWLACKTVLQRLLDEVKHANHLFHVSDASFHQYSHVMYTIHKDIFLDDQGKRVLSSARQQLLLKQRGAGNIDGARDDQKDAAADGYLDPLYNSFSVLSDTMMKTVMDRESDNGTHVATIEFQEFCEELISQAEAMKALGDSVVAEMEGSEQDIQNAFCEYLILLAEVMQNRGN